MNETCTSPAGSRIRALALLAVFGIAAGGCEVINPGPVQDEYLNLTEVHQSLVNGAGRRLSQAIGQIGYTGALAAREIIPGGQTGNGGHNPIAQAGHLLPTEHSGHWNNAHQARWIAEDAIRRFKDVVGTANVSPDILATAYLWAGYANRLLGENMCEAVFDGGAAEPNRRYFERAQEHFSSAIAVASGDLKLAAYAGRASARVWLRDWTGAVSDAQQVPLAFVHKVAASGAAEETRNFIYFANSNTPYRGYSIWRTWFDDYYAQTGDPRTSWGADAAVPFANTQLSGYGPVPWKFQTKYTSVDDGYRLSTGREMVLIRAEALLEEGKWAEAMGLLNSLRTSMISRTTGQALQPWSASSAEEAWTFLKRERGIELWLEARRLGDIRRWTENQTPGVLDWPDFEAISVLFRNNPPSKCFPVPDSERNTNLNIK